MSQLAGTIIYKMTGSGNDFVYVDGRHTPVGLWSPERIQEVCSRRTGVGADGLVVLEPGAQAHAVRFYFFNSDGSRAAMCGNASLCATRIATRLGLGPASGMTLDTDAGSFQTRCVAGRGERAELFLADVCDITKPNIELLAGESGAYLTTVGVPHLIVPVADTAAPEAAPETRGRELRCHTALGPDGANVSFVALLEDRSIMRTYERGVEAETLACGTGAVAAAAILGLERRIELPWSVETASGATLHVSGTIDHEAAALRAPRLDGEARLVYRAVLS